MPPPRRSRRQAGKAAGTFGEDDQADDEALKSTSEVQVEVPIRRKGKGKRRASETEETEAGPSSKKQKTDDSEPKPLDEKALLADIKIDYSKIKSKTKAVKKPKKQVWGKMLAPITDREKTPRGWNPQEPDLMPDDLDAQIKRCQERIKDNIMPHVYEIKLKELIEEKKERDEKMAAEPGLSWPVVQRLEDLNLTLKWLEKEENGHEMIDTVQAIIAGYRSGGLEWCEGLVTYWHGGVKLCEPRPFKWDEYRFMHDRSNGHTGFWVEGLDGPGPMSSKVCMTLPPKPPWNQVVIPISLRIPLDSNNSNGPALNHEFDFMDDTGCSDICIFAEDVILLQNLDTQAGVVYPLPRCLGIGVHVLADGTKMFFLHRELEINMWNPKDMKWMLPNWDPISIYIMPGKTSLTKPRLSGPWLRHRLYSATVPDTTKRLWLFDYNPSYPPEGERALPSAHPDQMRRPFPARKLLPASDVPEFDPNLPAGG